MTYRPRRMTELLRELRMMRSVPPSPPVPSIVGHPAPLVEDAGQRSLDGGRSSDSLTTERIPTTEEAGAVSLPPTPIPHAVLEEPALAPHRSYVEMETDELREHALRVCEERGIKTRADFVRILSPVDFKLVLEIGKRNLLEDIFPEATRARTSSSSTEDRSTFAGEVIRPDDSGQYSIAIPLRKRSLSELATLTQTLQNRTIPVQQRLGGARRIYYSEMEELQATYSLFEIYQLQKEAIAKHGREEALNPLEVRLLYLKMIDGAIEKLQRMVAAAENNTHQNTDAPSFLASKAFTFLSTGVTAILITLGGLTLIEVPVFEQAAYHLNKIWHDVFHRSEINTIDVIYGYIALLAVSSILTTAAIIKQFRNGVKEEDS